MQMNRIGLSVLAILGVILSSNAISLAQAQPVTLNWLDKTPPAVGQGISWGVPWPKGAVPKNATFSLKAPDGSTLPVQSWPLAYWPDGSLKWSGLATLVGPQTANGLQVVPGAPTAPATALQVNQTGDSIEINTGALICRIPKQGPALIESISVNGNVVARQGRLELIVQNAPDIDVLNPAPREMYVGTSKTVTLEQSGPVRAVVKIEGMHKSQKGSREWLPFVVRLYFYAGQESARMVHTIIFDGDQEKDFIRGMGLAFDVPMRQEVQNRHVRFTNSNGGVFAEPVLLPAGGGGGGGPRGGRGRGGDAAAPATQPGGRAPQVPVAAGGRGGHLDGAQIGPTNSELARWDAYKLVQANSKGFTIVKRTNPQSTWIGAAEGDRASGLAFVGDTTGGLGVGVKNFWQSYPASLEIQGASTETAKIYAWLWSPDGPVMDTRHYDTRGHGPVNGGSGSYEDYEKDFATPEGVARTSELMLFATGKTPSREETAGMASAVSTQPLLVTTPAYLHSTGIFGLWSLEDRSTPFKAQIEDRLKSMMEYYQTAIEQHHWYGFWNFGDVRHAYDTARHMWRYDVGGYAWDNTELGSVLWPWYNYIRTGRADWFRMAEAMTRHCSEVDTAHLGRFKGLGSRHNVSHWGDSAKEARVSQSAHNRFYYYLTTDERIGDIMKMVVDVDEIASKLDPMRKAQPKTPEEAKYPGRIRVGPDWLAFVGNWMTEWERTGDTKYRDKIMAGVNSMAEMPYWMRSGRALVMGYDPATGKLYKVNNEVGGYNLPTIQGGGEVAIELTDLLNEPVWTKMWLQYCRLGRAPAEVLIKDKETGTEGADASMVGEQGNDIGPYRLGAFAYYKTRSKPFAEYAVNYLRGRVGALNMAKIDGSEVLNPVDESAGVSTNDAAQSSLQLISILEMCKDQLPTEAVAPGEGRGRGRGRGGQ